MNDAVGTARALKERYDSSAQVSRKKFNISTREMLFSGNAVQAFEWVHRMPHSQRRQFVEAARSEGLFGFQIIERVAQGSMKETGQRSEYFPARQLGGGHQF
jgi:tRNA(Glu) U13 pseudouridine synthase TruD